MNPIAQRTLLASALVCSAIVPARADATADVQSKVDAAMKNAKSFVVTTLYPAQSYSSTLVYVAPDRSRVAVAINASTTDVVVVGGTSYSSKNGAPFEKSPITPEQSARLASPGNIKVGTLRADVTIGGVRYGAFDTTVPFGTDVTLTCAYDKKSYRLARCTNSEVTQTYNNYDDPRNVVEAPANAVDAPTPKATN